MHLRQSLKLGRIRSCKERTNELMKKIRFLVHVIACMALALGMTACGGKTTDIGTQNSVQNVEILTENNETPAAVVSEPDKTETDMTEANSDVNGEIVEQEQTGSGKDTLVVVFSATGTTKGVAERIAAITDAYLYEIIPAEPYSDADLDWNDKNSRTTIEQNDASVKPAIAGEVLSLDGYKTIYIGYPIWWAIEPRIMDTFVEGYNFDGITMIPFCTSGSSGIGKSGKNLEEHAGSGTWLDGKRFSGNVSDEDLKKWIDSLQLER